MTFLYFVGIFYFKIVILHSLAFAEKAELPVQQADFTAYQKVKHKNGINFAFLYRK